jgi:ATP-dependent protease HslVU (ClpYQ) peptidase subunit
VTTIAVDTVLGCMAADTRCSDESGISYPVQKIFRIGESLFGTAGLASMGLVMIEWLKTSRNRQQLYKQWSEENYYREEIWLIELNPKGIFLWDGWGVPERVLLEKFAIGSGNKAANALLNKGFSPEDAVRGAIDCDIYTKDPVHVEWLLPPELAPKRTRRKR